MGQAKQRGTKAERVWMAQKRNRILEESIEPGTTLDRLLGKIGVQNLATRLIAMQLSAPPRLSNFARSPDE